jgi:hypothetical protein
VCRRNKAAAPAVAVSPRSRGFVNRLQGVTGDVGREAEASRLAMAAKEEVNALAVERERLATQLALMQRDKAHLAASLTANVTTVEEAQAVLTRALAMLQVGPP